MISKSDLQKEYENELARYRTQQVVIGALMAVKDNVGKIDPDIVQAINITHLADELKMNREEVDSLFGKICFVIFHLWQPNIEVNALLFQVPHLHQNPLSLCKRRN